MRATRVLPVLALFAGVFLLPPLGGAEPPTPEEFAASRENLKQIGGAHQLFADANLDKWAGDITDKDGKRLLSWRVAILPYIEEDALYKQFKLDERWDSDNNKKLIEKMPKVYAPVRVKAKAGETFYQRFVGKGALFTQKGTPYTVNNVPDGRANTVLVVEALDPVIWSKPADVPFDEKRLLPQLGGLFDGVFHIGMCDGSVIRVRKDFDADELKKAIAPNNGKILDRQKLTK